MKIKVLIDKAEQLAEYNPLNNEITLEDDTHIKWSIDPKWSKGDNLFENINSSKINFEVNKPITDKDVTLSLNIDGELQSFVSPAGENGFRVSMGISKRF